MTLALYILMRTDLDSLTPGKAMAQASHAYGALKAAVRPKYDLQAGYLEWMGQTEQEFGTTIVLGGTFRQIGQAIDRANNFYNTKLVYGWVTDPTYPVKDGAITHLVPLLTCAFIFGDRKFIADVAHTMELHP